jgi:multidrug efflux pump subunit AcrB
MSQATIDIKDAVDKTTLPADAETPTVQDVSTNNETMFSVILYGDKDKYSAFYLKEQ